MEHFETGLSERERRIKAWLSSRGQKQAQTAATLPTGAKFIVRGVALRITQLAESTAVVQGAGLDQAETEALPFWPVLAQLRGGLCPNPEHQSIEEAAACLVSQGVRGLVEHSPNDARPMFFILGFDLKLQQISGMDITTIGSNLWPVALPPALTALDADFYLMVAEGWFLSLDPEKHGDIAPLDTATASAIMASTPEDDKETRIMLFSGNRQGEQQCVLARVMPGVEHRTMLDFEEALGVALPYVPRTW